MLLWALPARIVTLLPLRLQRPPPRAIPTWGYVTG